MEWTGVHREARSRIRVCGLSVEVRGQPTGEVYESVVVVAAAVVAVDVAAVVVVVAVVVQTFAFEKPAFAEGATLTTGK